MKVAMVTVFPAAPDRVAGGVEGAAKYLVDELAALPGLELTVVAPQSAPAHRIVLEDWGAVRVYRLPRRGPWRSLPGTVYDLAAGKREVLRLVDALGPDVVHFQGNSFLAAGCGARGVLTIHGVAEKDAAWDRRGAPGRWLKRQLLRRTEDYGRRTAPNVIAISAETERLLPPNAARRVWRIPNPVADSFFRVERRPEPGRVLCCSRLTRLKNVAGLIEAFAAAARERPAARLRVAGPGEPAYEAACRAAAARCGVGERVSFLGALGVAALQEEVSSAACFALASFQENAPLSLAEALAAGVPALGPAVGGVPEMLEGGKAGLLVDPRDPRALASALARLLDEPAEADLRARRGREGAQARRASVVARRTAEVYARLAGAA